MRRSIPLQELPLEDFTARGSSHHGKSSFHSSQRPSKRSLSPIPVSLFSPTKRRLLDEEGIVYDKKAVKSLAFSRYQAGQAAQDDFFGGTVFASQKLEFGSPKPHRDRGAEVAPSVNSNPIPNTPSSSKISASQLPDSSRSSSVLGSVDETATGGLRRSSRIRALRSHVSVMMIPRETPIPPDRQSYHYPGFDVFQDTQIPIPCASTSCADVIDASLLALSELSVDREGSKENIPPKKRAKKADSQYLAKESSQESPEMSKRRSQRFEQAKHSSITPKNKSAAAQKDSVVTPNSRRLSPDKSLSRTIPTPKTATPAQRREGRRLLEEEADDIDDDDDDDCRSFASLHQA